MSDDASGLIAVEVRGLMHDPATRTPIVVLRDPVGERFLPIWIGLFEAQAIALALDGLAPPRPLTHDLLASVITELGGTLEHVVVCSLQEGTFHAQLEVLRGEATALIDARPSDAIALALRLGCPIFVHASVFEAATRGEGVGESTAGGEDEKIRKVLESLSVDDPGKYKM